MKTSIIRLSIVFLLLGFIANYAMASTEPVTPVVQKAVFPGGYDSLSRHIAHHLDYPRDARENGIEGEVMVSFDIATDGTVTNIKVIKGLGFGCNQAAVKAVTNMPDWEPATVDGKPVRSRVRMPIRFALN